MVLSVMFYREDWRGRCLKRKKKKKKESLRVGISKELTLQGVSSL